MSILAWSLIFIFLNCTPWFLFRQTPDIVPGSLPVRFKRRPSSLRICSAPPSRFSVNADVDGFSTDPAGIFPFNVTLIPGMTLPSTSMAAASSEMVIGIILTKSNFTSASRTSNAKLSSLGLKVSFQPVKSVL